MGFLDRLETGRAFGEEPVAQLLRRWYVVEPCGPDDQKLGRDLWAVPIGQSGPRQSVEVKWSSRPMWHWIETHGAGLCEQGWAFTSQADIFALVTESEIGEAYALLLPAEDLRSHVRKLLEQGASICNGRAQDSGRPGGKGFWARSMDLQRAAPRGLTIYYLPRLA